MCDVNLNIKLSKLGTIKNQLLAYAIAAGTLLLWFGKKVEPPTQAILMYGGMSMFFAGPVFWFIAFWKLPASAQELAFLGNTIQVVQQDRVLRSDNNNPTVPRAERSGPVRGEKR